MENLTKPVITVFSEKQKEKIHNSVLQLLGKTGIIVKEPEMLEILRANGAKIKGKEKVKLPADLVEEAISKAPKKVVIYNREGKEALVLEDRKSYYGVHGDAPFILDSGAQVQRKFVRRDAVKIAKLCDALGNIDFLSQNGFGDDIPNPKMAAPIIFKLMAENTSKPLGFSCYDTDSMKIVLEIADAIKGSRKALQERPFFYHYSEPTTPLVHSAPSLRRLIMAVRNNIPLVYTPMPMSGATAPVSFAGTIALGLAETLCGVVFAQLISPGAPCIIGGITTIMDMRTTICSYGAPEMLLMVSGMTEMAHYYHLLMFGTAGCTDSKTVDQQAAIESSLSCMTAGLTGANLIHDVGLIYHAETVSLDMMTLSDEIIGMVKSYLKGIRTEKEDLALEEIDKVQPGGNFLTEEHTLTDFRNFWSPRLFDRTMKKVSGKEFNFSNNLTQRTNNLLSSHQSLPFPREVRAELDKVEKCCLLR